ncbi:helix-turn-helix domain-containing protein [Gordonia caeni]|uniref:Helix-turn-helix domain-containing protein n=1 Tax=Gordonia caeni TaxID=1007097 RepID=A0ABP7PC75_9ACTN
MTAVAATLPQFSREDLDKLGVTCDVVMTARALGVSERHVRTLIDRGEFPIRVLRIGSRIVIPTADLKAYVLGDTVLQPDLIGRLDDLLESHREVVRLLGILVAAQVTPAAGHAS